MKRIYALAVAGAVSCSTLAQLSDAGEPTLSEAQRAERAAVKQRENEAAEAARAALRPEVTKSPTTFEFGGGTLGKFIDSIREQFGVDLTKIGTVPESMYLVQVPKMQMEGGKAPGGVQNTLSYRNVLALYNQVSDEPNVGIGRWIMKGGNHSVHPDVLMLVPSRTPEGSDYNVRAFAFPTWGKAGDEKLRMVQDVIREQQHMLTALAESGQRRGLTREDAQGEVNYHRATGIMVVQGGKIYVEMASAIIQAAKERADISEIPIPPRPEVENE